MALVEPGCVPPCRKRSLRSLELLWLPRCRRGSSTPARRSYLGTTRAMSTGGGHGYQPLLGGKDSIAHVVPRELSPPCQVVCVAGLVTLSHRHVDLDQQERKGDGRPLGRRQLDGYRCVEWLSFGASMLRTQELPSIPIASSHHRQVRKCASRPFRHNNHGPHQDWPVCIRETRLPGSPFNRCVSLSSHAMLRIPDLPYIVKTDYGSLLPRGPSARLLSAQRHSERRERSSLPLSLVRLPMPR